MTSQQLGCALSRRQRINITVSCINPSTIFSFLVRATESQSYDRLVQRPTQHELLQRRRHSHLRWVETSGNSVQCWIAETLRYYV